MQLLVEGTTFDAERACELGLVNEVIDADGHADFLDRVQAYARKFTPPAKAALAVGAIKRAVQSGAEMSLEQGLALERELQSELFASDDAREGLVAFVEKRTPKFEAR
jgi:enoyl-CoA hydratase/carnithine racemase